MKEIKNLENNGDNTELFLQMVLSLSSDLLFRYNLIDQTIQYFGATRELLGLPEEASDYPSSIIEAGVVYADDYEVLFAQLSDMQKGIETSRDIRLCDGKGGFDWYKKEYRVCYDLEGRPVEIIGRFCNIQQQKDMESKANFDNLTGCYRKTVFERLAKIHIQAHPDKGHSLMLVDLDNFKAVNDNLGHQFGDMVLSEVGAKLKSVFRNTDYVGRIGGDEFMIFIKDTTDADVLKRLANKVLEKLDVTYKGTHHSYHVSGSIGITTYPQNGETFQELYDNSDIALCDAKNRGKNGCVFYDPTLSKGTMDNTLPFDIASRTLSQHFDSKIIAEVFNLLFETNEIEISLQNVLRIIGNRFGVSRAYIFEKSPNGVGFYDNSYEWCADGIEPEKQNLQGLSLEDFMPVFSKANEEGIIYCNDFHSFDDKNAQDILENQDIQSILHAYIRSGDEFNYLVGFDDCEYPRIWSPIEIATLLYVSKIIAQFLSYNKALDAAKIISDERMSVLDSLNYSAYIIDIQTYKLTYFNDYTKQIFKGLKIGDVCYKKLRNKKSECEDCPLKFMRERKANAVRVCIHNDILDVDILVNATRLTSFDGKESIFVSGNELVGYA